MINLLSYCGLTNSRLRASDTDLPVIFIVFSLLIPRKKIELFYAFDDSDWLDSL